MNVKEAVAAAKSYLAQVFDEEDIEDLRLEEVVFQPNVGWLITLGFLRSAPLSGKPISAIPKNMQKLLSQKPREYKVVTVDEVRGATSIRNREGLPVG